MDDFSQWIRTMRAVHRMSQIDMARYLHVSPSCLQKWEQRQRTPKELTRQAIEQKIRKLK